MAFAIKSLWKFNSKWILAPFRISNSKFLSSYRASEAFTFDNISILIDYSKSRSDVAGSIISSNISEGTKGSSLVATTVLPDLVIEG